MLYIVSTPIGNLKDLSFRAVDALKHCDYILCEDTRHSLKLLQNYEIKVPLRSFHKFKESAALPKILSDLKEGKEIALISDAGTPLISDPGESLVEACIAAQLPVTVVPGPCAAIAALTLSGFTASPFQFLGFLPKKEGELKQALCKALLYPGTSIFYETPHRIETTLEWLHRLSPSRQLCIVRELTKIHEEALRGNATSLLDHFKRSPPRGEMILLLAPAEEKKEWSLAALKELVFFLQEEFSLEKMEAIKLAAEISGVSKKEIYKEFFNLG